MPPIAVICGAGALGRNHSGSQRRLRRALRSKSRAVDWLLQTSQNLSADTNLRFKSVDVFNLEDAFGIEVAKLGSETVAALGNDSDAAPAPVADAEDARDHVLRHWISFPC